MTRFLRIVLVILIDFKVYSLNLGIKMSLVRSLLECKNVDEIKAFVCQNFKESLITLINHQKHIKKSLEGESSKFYAYNKNLIAEVSSISVSFYFGRLDNRDHCDNFITVQTSKLDQMICYLSINTGTPKKPEYIKICCNCLGLLGNYLE